MSKVRPGVLNARYGAWNVPSVECVSSRYRAGVVPAYRLKRRVKWL
jgi:hypothetical protein